MSDLTRMYEELGDTVEPGALASPADLRHRADRRARRRTLVLVAGAVLAIAGTAVAVPNLVPNNRSGPDVTTTPTAPPTDRPSPTPPATTPTPTTPTTPPTGDAAIRPPTTIPDRAFLTQPANTLAGDTRRSPDGERTMPDLCDRKFASDASIAARRSLVHPYVNPPPDPNSLPHGYLVQTITSYRDGGAAEFMDQLADAVWACRQGPAGSLLERYALVTPPEQGDEALKIRIRRDLVDMSGTGRKETADTFVTVLRVGPVVTILHDIAFEDETGATTPELMRTFTRLASENIDDWLK